MIAALIAVQLVLLDAPVDSSVRRFAVVAGANDGGKGRVLLRYAGSDARSVSSVLTQLGGVAPADLLFLDEPRPGEVRKALDDMKERLEAARRTAGRLEVLFYYSGHSDETGLLLHDERLGYDELRRRLDGLPAEVRIAIVDSCASGALTLSKGGVSRPPFLADASNQLKGHAFLTSASVDEAAQESERLKASVFTHALVSGLRGAADTSRDGRVTLAEAYQFAFSNTLASTASTRAGPQRPAFDMQLVGTGEVVLTDVRVASSQLELDAALAGRIFVMSSATGALVVELAKAAGSPMQLGVEPGAYRVLVDEGRGRLGQAEVALLERQTRRIDARELVPVSPEVMVSRGGTVDEPLPYLPVDIAFLYPVSMGGFTSRAPRTSFSLGVLLARDGEINGAAVSSVGTWVDGPMRGVAVTGVGLKSGGLYGVGLASSTVVTVGELHGVAMAATTITTGPQVGLTAAAVNVAANRVAGGQLGAVNVTTGPMAGTQLGALNVTAGNFGGFQAGAANIAAGSVGGLQAGAFNLASGPQVVGAQLGVLNIGGEVTGAQVGILNIAAKVKGTQVGLLNIAGEATAPVGLLSIMASKGGFRAAAWTNETSVANVAVKLGGKNVYSYATAGLNPNGARYSVGLGLGVRVDIGRWYGMLEGDASALSAFSGESWGRTLVVSERLAVGYTFADVVSVFAGPSLTQLLSLVNADVTGLSPWGVDLARGHRLVPGLVVGVQFF